MQSTKAFVTKGIDIHPNVEQQASELKKDISSILTDSSIDFNFISATTLVENYRKRDNTVFNLKLSENHLSLQGKVFISLVKLRDYYDFITDEEGQIIKHIFESNVRDYQGRTSVNQEIRETLEDHDSKEDFWRLNNGVTILANDVSAPGGKELIIHNPEIVNGLQTSNEVYLHFQLKKKENPAYETTRSLLVRVLVPENESSLLPNVDTGLPAGTLRTYLARH